MSEPLEIPFSEFDEYIRQGEPDQREKAGIWSVAIGLQQVDGLQTSDFLRQTALRNIEGEISIEEVGKAVREYYISKSQHEVVNEDEQEADRVSANIAAILRSKTFNFSTLGYISIHRRIFDGVMKHAGELRKYDITKKEWVLQGDTVLYLNWEDLRMALNYDLEQEKNFSYVGLSQDDMISHLTKFVSSLWQIHAFPEGNTRTTAVFIILYLRSLGWQVDNDMFAKHAWYFRNALVRANYHNVQKGIDYTFTYLERFFRNLLLGEAWDLRSRYLHIAAPKEWRVQPQLTKKTSVQIVKTSEKKQKTSVQIVKLLRDNPTYTAETIAKLLGKTTRAIEMQLAKLSQQQIISHDGPNKGGRWIVKIKQSQERLDNIQE
ncbi:MAG: Fic family protein [Bacteroidales bacterium]|nr:Fic family protein [Candidatus Colicola equi]